MQKEESSMTQLIRCYSILFLCFYFLLSSHPVKCQTATDTIDIEAIEQFANYLYNLELYDFASQEYERLLYLDSNNPKYLSKLIRSYRGAQNETKLKQRFNFSVVKDTAVVKDYLYALISESMNEEASEFYSIQEPALPESLSNKLSFELSLAKRDWESSLMQYEELDLESKMVYEPLMENINGRKYKSPTLAGVMSTLVPGSGRFYAKDSKDGIISMLFIFSAAYQAYRGFNKKGKNSVSGWIYSGVGLGFYIGNIYGSYKSAQIYNARIDERLHSESLKYFGDF